MLNIYLALGPPDADIVVLVRQMELGEQVGFCVGGLTRVPVKTGDGSWKTFDKDKNEY